MKSTCADLRQKFLLAREKAAGILTGFKFSDEIQGEFLA